MSGSNGSSNGDDGGGSWAYLPPGAFSGADMPPGIAEGFEPEMSFEAEPPPPVSPEPRPAVAPLRRVRSEQRPGLPAPPQQPAPQGALPLQPGGPRARRGPAPRQMVPAGMLPVRRSFGAVQPATVNRHLLGASTVVLGVGSLLGGHFGGLYGSIAGALFVGSALNAFRASSAALQPDPEQQKQAKVSAVYALIGGAVGGYVWWKKAEPRRATPNPRRRQTVRRNEARHCGSRPIGP